MFLENLAIVGRATILIVAFFLRRIYENSKIKRNLFKRNIKNK